MKRAHLPVVKFLCSSLPGGGHNRPADSPETRGSVEGHDGGSKSANWPGLISSKLETSRYRQAVCCKDERE